MQFLADNWRSANAYSWDEKTHKTRFIKYLTNPMERISISLRVRDISKVKDDVSKSKKDFNVST